MSRIIKSLKKNLVDPTEQIHQNLSQSLHNLLLLHITLCTHYSKMKLTTRITGKTTEYKKLCERCESLYGLCGKEYSKPLTIKDAMKFPKYYLAAVTAFVIWGFFSFGLKPIHDYPSQDILFYRVFTCIILMIVINFTLRRDKIKETRTYLKALTKTERRNQWLLIAGSSVLLTGNWGMFIYVMNQISVKAASFAYLVCPILTTFFAFIILKERLHKVQWLAVFMSFVSCAILSYNDLRDAMFSIVVAATYALYLVLQKRITMPDRFILLTLQIGIVALILLPFYPVYSSTPPVEVTFYLFILLIAVLFTIIPMFLNLFAMKGINSSTIGILIYLNPLIAFALAIFYYKEDISFEQILSYSLILVSIVVFNIGSYLKMKAIEKN